MTDTPAKRHYFVELNVPAHETPCKCTLCGWVGPLTDLLVIVSCSLTPGDPVPAGRCQWCFALAIIVNADNPYDRLGEVLHAARLLQNDTKKIRNQKAVLIAKFRKNLDDMIRRGLGEEP